MIPRDNRFANLFASILHVSGDDPGIQANLYDLYQYSPRKWR